MEHEKNRRNGNLIRAAHAAGAFALFAAAAAQADLDISPNALEAVIPVEPNIVLLNDDSGSMDFEIMTTDADGEFAFTATQPDGSDASGDGDPEHRGSCRFHSGTFNFGYLYIAEFESNTFGDDANDCNTADDNAWRPRNSDFNRLYFNPQQTYEPWAGVDANGDPYADIDITQAPDDPYDPSDSKDLTSEGSSWEGGSSHATLSGGFRFYTWTDTDDDGNFDDDDDVTEYRIGDLSGSDLDTLNNWLSARHGSSAKQYASTAELQQNFANWFGYYRSREFAAKAGLSRVIQDNTSARIGYATINSSSTRIPVASMNVSPNSGNKRSLLDRLYGTHSEGGTPLRNSLHETGKYFACNGGIFRGGVPCPQTRNEDGSANAGGACRQNYTVLMTDGYYSGGSPGVGNADGEGKTDFDGGAFADSHPNTLADVAMEYYEDDLHTGLGDLVPTTRRDRNLYRGSGELGDTMHQHMSTYTVGFGVDGSLSAMPNGPDDDWTWPDPTSDDLHKIDDLRHTAFNGRGMFLSAADPEELTDSLQEIFEEIAAGVGTGSAVAFNTQNIRTNSLVFRAFYNTKTSTGDLIAQEVESDGTLGETVWSGAEQLDGQTGRDSSNRRQIITFDPDTNAGIPFRWTDVEGTPHENALNATPPDPANFTDGREDEGGLGDERLGWVRGHSEDEGIAREAGELREREVVKGRLGDITHSSPVFVGEPQFTGRSGGVWPSVTDANDVETYTYPRFKKNNADRRELVYVGANDGMLHAFDAETGEERFAYVPSVLVDGLPELADPEYDHRFYVDASPTVNDVYMQGGWHTVLMGGLGAGGRGYFALDVTDPSDFDTETSASSRVLWEFTPEDDASLGLTYSEPLIAMSNAVSNDNQRWVAIFGNGYNSDDPDGNASLFIAFIEEGMDGEWTTGDDYIKIDTGVGIDDYDADTMPHMGSDTPNGIGGVRVIDWDGDGTADYVYAGDLQGNLYRFDISSSNPGGWGLDGVLFQATYVDPTEGTQVQPITQRPVAVRHPEGGLMLMQGTGSWMTTSDASSEEIQSIYGIWDTDPSKNNMQQVSAGDLLEQELINQVDPVHDYVVRTSTNNELDWSNNGHSGWRIDLDMPPAGSADGDPPEFPGERAVRNLQLRGGVAFVNTVIPKDDAACGTIIGGFELGLDPLTGGTPDKVVFDTNGDGVFDLNDNVGGAEGTARQVTGVRFEGGIPTDAGFIENIRITQVGEEVRAMGTNTGGAGAIGRRSWREIVRGL